MSRSTRLSAAALAVLVAGLAGSGTSASTDLCGTTIVEDLTLDQDLTCAAAGLVVGADGISINLQGHSLTGSGTGAGIAVVGRAGVTIKGGTIANFFTGVLVNHSTDVVIKDSVLLNHVDGVDLQAGSTGVEIKASRFEGNRTRGIMMRGEVTDIVVKDNTFHANRVGVLLFGPTRATVKANIITDSLLAGIRVNFPATGNLVLDNVIASNPAGIEFLPSATGTGATGNAFLANTLMLNTCGFKGPGTGNTFQDNLFSGNATDVCG